MGESDSALNMFADCQWRNIAWNGIRLEVPFSWQPKVILASYLLFEYQEQPVFEIKWQPCRGSHTAERILASIRRQLTADDFLESWLPPNGWRNLWPEYNISGFRLTSKGKRQHGLIMHCSACNTVSLLQFYDHPHNDCHSMDRLLLSYSDHSGKAWREWTIFDIQARLPTDAILQSHEFFPGRFTLHFRLQKSAITLYRLKPAAILLKQSSLRELGATFADCGEPTELGDTTATWTKEPGRLGTLLRLRTWCWLQLRHLGHHNAVLGVKGEGKGPLDLRLLERIGTNFQTMSPE